jgi:hypothetical protein
MLQVPVILGEVQEKVPLPVAEVPETTMAPLKVQCADPLMSTPKVIVPPVEMVPLPDPGSVTVSVPLFAVAVTEPDAAPPAPV